MQVCEKYKHLESSGSFFSYFNETHTHMMGLVLSTLCFWLVVKDAPTAHSSVRKKALSNSLCKLEVLGMSEQSTSSLSVLAMIRHHRRRDK